MGNSACPFPGLLPLAFMPFSAGPAGARQGPVGLHNSLSYPILHCSASHVYFLSPDSKEFTCRWRSKILREGWTQRCPGVRDAQPTCVQGPPGRVLPGQTLWVHYLCSPEPGMEEVLSAKWVPSGCAHSCLGTQRGRGDTGRSQWAVGLGRLQRRWEGLSSCRCHPGFLQSLRPRPCSQLLPRRPPIPASWVLGG